MTAIALVVLGAAIAGLAANVFLHPRMQRANAKYGVQDSKTDSWAGSVLGPSVTLLALFLAFVLAGASGSFSEAKSAAQSESTVVQRVYRTAGFLEEPYRLRLQRSALCYARAVAGPEWSAMADGDQSSLPLEWTGTGRNGLRRSFREMGADHVLFGKLTAADQARAVARRTRLTQASPSIPDALIVYLVAVFAAVLLFHAVTSPPRSVLHIAATAFSLGTVLAALGIIYTLDRPFSGAIEIKPTQMRNTAQMLSADFVTHYGGRRVGCDRDGKPTRSPA
jgi:hypothetical protein